MSIDRTTKGDVVIPAYDWFRLTLAFQTFFLSDRSAVLYHRLPDEFWRPLDCAAVTRALARPHDQPDARLLRFILDERYCLDAKADGRGRAGD